MGCGGSTIKLPDENDVRTQKVSIRVGSEARIIPECTRVIFIFGGPGSKKGRIVEDLVRMYDFKLINAEDLILKKAADSSSTDTSDFVTIRKYIKDHPEITTLRAILEEIMEEISAESTQSYLVSVMPNLKSFIKTEDYKKECTESMKRFEEKFPISFALNMAIPADKLIKKVVAECAKHTATTPVPGEQTDEADSSRTQKRALLYQNSVQCFLDYFQDSKRLVTVDVSGGITQLIWERVREFFIDTELSHLRIVNSVIIFTFNSAMLKTLSDWCPQIWRHHFDWKMYRRLCFKHAPYYCQITKDDQEVQLMSQFDIQNIALKNKLEKSNTTTEKVLQSLCRLIDTSDPSEQAMTIDLRGTALANDIMPCKNGGKTMLHFSDIEEGPLNKYINNLQPCKVYPEYKAIYSTDSDVYLFPKDRDNSICENIALTLTSLRDHHRSEAS